MTQKNIQMKRAYVKPSMKVYPLNVKPQLLVGSSVPVDPTPSPYQW